MAKKKSTKSIPKHLTVPEARELLSLLAREHNMPELGRIANALVRRSTGKKRADPTSKPARASVKRAIVAFVAAHEDMALHQVASVFNVNPGRVSEALMEHSSNAGVASQTLH